MLNAEIKTLTNKIGDEKLRKKVVELLKNPTFEIDGKTIQACLLILRQQACHTIIAIKAAT